MKTPSFWYTPPGLLSSLLRPLGWLYGKGGEIYQDLKTAQHFSIPIISVGNIICGGSGKTPVAIALAKLLKKKGFKIHFVTRGYGGTVQGPIKVIPSLHTAKEVGDEPLLLVQHAPTWVAKDRRKGVQKAVEEGAELVILDDGHQTSGLHKDISLVVVDLVQGFGNGCVLPAGPLRENLEEGLARATAIIGVGDGDFATPKPFFRAHTIPRPFSFSSQKVVAFCGLGFPQKFYKSLKESCVNAVATKSFPDHYAYTEKDLEELQKLARSLQATLVTTRKDWVRLSPSWQQKVQVLDIEIQFEDEAALLDLLHSIVNFSI